MAKRNPSEILLPVPKSMAKKKQFAIALKCGLLFYADHGRGTRHAPFMCWCVELADVDELITPRESATFSQTINDFLATNDECFGEDNHVYLENKLRAEGYLHAFKHTRALYERWLYILDTEIGGGWLDREYDKRIRKFFQNQPPKKAP